MSVGEREVDYIRWQNRAFRFYLAARVLAHNYLPGPMAFCAQQAIELLLKATLVFWDGSFRPTVAGHKFRKMIRAVGNKVPKGKQVQVPSYFFEDQRFLSVSRYPSSGRGVPIPSTLIVDLDRVFADLVALVPVRVTHSELAVAVSGVDRRALLTLRRGNRQMRHLLKTSNLKASHNNRLQATAGGRGGAVPRVGRSPAAPEPER